jgi:hypothetical protein
LPATIEEARTVNEQSPSRKPRRSSRPAGKDGLLDGVAERLEPFMAWSALVIGVAALLGTLAIMVVMLVNGEVAVALLVMVAGGFVTAAAFWNWVYRRRRMRRKGGKV